MVRHIFPPRRVKPFQNPPSLFVHARHMSSARVRASAPAPAAALLRARGAVPHVRLGRLVQGCGHNRTRSILVGHLTGASSLASFERSEERDVVCGSFCIFWSTSLLRCRARSLIVAREPREAQTRRGLGGGSFAPFPHFSPIFPLSQTEIVLYIDWLQ